MKNNENKRNVKTQYTYYLVFTILAMMDAVEKLFEVVTEVRNYPVLEMYGSYVRTARLTE